MYRATARHAHRPSKGFSFIEVMVAAAVIAVFAMLVVPGLANASRPMGGPVREMLDADLRRARTESMVRGEPVAMVAARDGSGWWLAPAHEPATKIDGTYRGFGRGGLAPLKGATLFVKGDQEGDGTYRVFAEFDTLGSRDEGTPALELRDRDGKPVESWTLPAGRTRLATVR